MIKRALDSTGLQVSALGLGCNNFGSRLDPERTRLVVDAAIAAGINFIDTADAYGPASILARRPISRAIDPATKDCNGGGLLFEPSAFGM
jgi:aryl-alcohol dehydrogenase-like predicted oxidoreductase